ncbi:MAG TPA: hypothetical protein VNA16_11335, partial [Abditibacteriaceae bacterium]|nr:hypothetical protein [Abditibacteriaceae bacterium]
MKVLLKSLTLCAVLALYLQLSHPQLSHSAGAATPQTPPPVVAPRFPELQVAPGVLLPGGNVTLTLPTNFPLSNTRLRVGLFEQGRPVLVADALRNFTLREGRFQTTLTVQADPGWYDFRIISNDRARIPLSPSSSLLVPGIKREPGWWLLNGTLSQQWIAVAGRTPSTLPAPLFIPGLTRDLGKKSKPAPRNIAVASTLNLEWQTFKLPSLRNMLDTKALSFTTFGPSLAKQMQEVQAAGGRNYLGFELSTGSEATPLPANVGDSIKALRQTLNSIAPGAALILRVDARYRPALAVRDIDACAPLCDAVVVVLPPFYDDSFAWPLKAARRVTEE